VAAMAAVSDKVENPEQAAMAEELMRDLRKRAKRVDQLRKDAETGTQRMAMQLGLRLTAIEAARAKLLSEHRDELGSDDMSALIAELDLEEQQIRLAMGER
jgi:monovalent cation/hydrogen antiporter